MLAEYKLTSNEAFEDKGKIKENEQVSAEDF